MTFYQAFQDLRAAARAAGISDDDVEKIRISVPDSVADAIRNEFDRVVFYSTVMYPTSRRNVIAGIEVVRE